MALESVFVNGVTIAFRWYFLIDDISTHFMTLAATDYIQTTF